MAKRKSAKKAARSAAEKGKAKPAKKSSAPKGAKKKAAKKPARKAFSSGGKKAAPVKQQVRQTTLAPYLNFNGSCEEAFNFYRSVFGGSFNYVGRFKEMPPMEGHPAMPEHAGNLIMHISLPIGSSTLMGSDSIPEFGGAVSSGTNFSVSVSATSRNEADRLYKALSNGGQQTMPISDTFWGSYFGMLTDRFGIQWMVSFDEKPM